MDHLLFELQPHLQELLSRTWLDQGDVTSNMCGVLERHCELYNKVRQPCRQVSVYTRRQKLHRPHNKMSVYFYQLTFCGHPSSTEAKGGMSMANCC